MNGLQIFNYQDAQVRTILKDGEPWFVAADVCRVLEIIKHRDAVARLEEDERGSVLVDTLGGPQEMAAINESGLYSLIMVSRKPEAKAFKRWITHDVLPSIRKTGGYSLQLPKTYSEALRMLADSVEREEINRPKVEAFNTFLGAKNSQTMNEVSKALNIGRNTLFSILREHQILMHNNLPYQRYINSDYFTVREVSIKAGEETKAQTLVTAKGIEYIRKVLAGKAQPLNS